MNMPIFVFGCFKQLLALNDGTLPPVSQQEFNSRLQNLANTFEIVCLASTQDNYNEASWAVGREYFSRVINDIETNVKHWESLTCAIDPSCWDLPRNTMYLLNKSPASKLAQKT